jgi:SAM-dependent methyltransferase
MSDLEKWETRYRVGDVPWDTGRPSTELQRVVAEDGIQPCRAIDLGCGTGTNAVWLARQGFDVTGVDLSPLAVKRARERAEAEGVTVRFLEADLLDAPDLGEPYPFLFDRGCYHVVRRVDVGRYLRTLERLTPPGGVGLVLAGNAREPHEVGPPLVSEEEIRGELGRLFEIVRLREFRFDSPAGSDEHFLAWSCLVRRTG